MTMVTGDGKPAKRPLSCEELEAAGADHRSALERFIAARLVVRTNTGSEIAHEALLLHWGRLRDWMESDRTPLGRSDGDLAEPRHGDRPNRVRRIVAAVLVVIALVVAGFALIFNR